MKPYSAEDNRAWVRAKIAEHGLTEEIEAEATEILKDKENELHPER